MLWLAYLFPAGRWGQVILAVREPEQHTLDAVLAAPGDHTEEVNAIGTSHLREPQGRGEWELRGMLSGSITRGGGCSSLV